MKNIYFFDIDGTLIDAKIGLASPTQATIEALNELKNEGHQIFIATGRSLAFVPSEIKALPFDGFITCNGASILIHDKEYETARISSQEIEKLICFAKNHQTILYLEEGEVVYTNDLFSKKQKAFLKRWAMDEEVVVDLPQQQECDIKMAMMRFDNEQQYASFKSLFQDSFAIMRHGDDLSCDICLKNFSKGSAIRKVLKHGHIPKENSFAFGDGYNDFEMFESVGTAIAMGNAVPELKEKATIITTSVENEGIAHYLKRQ